MGRVINPDSAGKLRTQLSKAVVLALRELMKQTDQDDYTRDLAAFIGFALVEIGNSVEVSVLAWEKRGYWVKADRFRLDWEWSGLLGKSILQALLDDDWAKIAQSMPKVAQKLGKITVAVRNRMGTPWEGAWDKLMDQR